MCRIIRLLHSHGAKHLESTAGRAALQGKADTVRMFYDLRHGLSSRKMIEVLSGEGEIYAGDRLVRRTRYRLSISEGDASSASGIEGTIELATESEAIVLTRVEQLTLLLDDGRYLAFSLASANGRIRAHGRLEGIKRSQR